MAGIKPEVGMGVTECVGSDSYAGTIVRVSPSGKTFWWQRDHYQGIREIKNMGDPQEYAYTPNTEGAVIKASLGKTGSWKSGGWYIGLGYRRTYFDPSF